ncbi:hypothetical protein HPB49_006307 [Dermacentor silvarum]|uniref:Uncharacterized protein n=1 Tax=Dermacentor silvarum TaxID=543639 RepID=A0ACB8CVJ0_DERSI|nr:hypothetical protein HPB49_006307 [Dermacentor silvarum]
MHVAETLQDPAYFNILKNYYFSHDGLGLRVGGYALWNGKWKPGTKVRAIRQMSWDASLLLNKGYPMKFRYDHIFTDNVACNYYEWNKVDDIHRSKKRRKESPPAAPPVTRAPFGDLKASVSAWRDASSNHNRRNCGRNCRHRRSSQVVKLLQTEEGPGARRLVNRPELDQGPDCHRSLFLPFTSKPFATVRMTASRLLLFRLATDYQNDGLATEDRRRGGPGANQRQRDETSTARSGTDTEGDQDSYDVSPLESVSDQQFPQLFKMNREVILKKRKTLRTQITNLVSDAEKKLEENHDPTAMSLIASQIKGIADLLKKADEQMK